MNQSSNQKDKAGYVCPSCRIVFALPRDLGGNGVVCHGCECLLTIPTSADKVSKIGLSRAKYTVAEPVTGSQETVVGQVGRGSSESPWADAQPASEEKGMGFILIAAFMSLFVLGGLAYFFLFGSSGEDKPVSDVRDLVSVRESEQQLETVEEVEVQPQFDSNDEKNLKRVDKFFTEYFGAKNVDEMLPYLRPEDGLREKLVKFYKGETLKLAAHKSILNLSNSHTYPDCLFFNTQTADFNTHFGVIEYKDEELRIDWGSYVGFSDMTWAELSEKKPTEPVQVRVTIKRAFYYNGEFMDERKWQAVSLLSPNEEELLYGYVERASSLDQLLFSFGNSDARQVVLEISYPRDTQLGNQVFINGIVSDNWFIEEEK